MEPAAVRARDLVQRGPAAGSGDAWMNGGDMGSWFLRAFRRDRDLRP
ncbi:MAG TPA: hypothetical protein VLM17_00380 [Xanthomonadaceae bacterium]|nr:hypothetical protein [Xanthomonadaceae bacterium]